MFRLSGVSHTYHPEAPGGPRFSLRDIDLTIRQGEYVTLAGANGSGKSTLLRHLNGLLVPTRGEVRVFGFRTDREERLRDIRSRVGMVFQAPDSQIVGTTVQEDVAFGPENLGVPHRELEDRVRWALRTAGLEGLTARPTRHLSGGQKQLLAVASAVAMKPECLLFDEATSMLDPASRDRMLRLMDRLHAEGMTVVAATHDMQEAARAGRVVVLREGEVAADEHPRALFGDRERVRALGLDLPPAAQVGGAVADLVPGFPRAPLDLEELVGAVLAGLAHPAGRSTSGGAPVRRNSCSGAAPGAGPGGGYPGGVPGGGVRAEDSAPVPGQENPLIQVRGLHHTYLTGTAFQAAALRGVSLTVRRGECAGVIGPAGSGKTTLLHHLNALLRPQRGEVVVDGLFLGDRGVDPVQVRSRVGLVFQSPEAQLFERYAGDDVAFGPRNLGLDREQVRDRVRRSMELVGLPFEMFKDRLTAELSSGEKRRLAMAGVLALEPMALALDEPTAGIDPAGRRHVLEILKRWGAGSAMVVVSHNMEDIGELCGRVLVLSGGLEAACGPAREVFSRHRDLRERGVGMPFTVELFAELNRRGVEVPVEFCGPDEAAGILARLLERG
ncbi:MAG: ABC transporter ATP-binding protein [Spirochaetota bacterium]